jgi:hypothetical protein
MILVLMDLTAETGEMPNALHGSAVAVCGEPTLAK